MEGLYKLFDNKGELPTFVRNLGEELEEILNGRAKVGHIRRSNLDTCFSLIWGYSGFSGDIMVSRSTECEEMGALTINHFWGIDTASGNYSPQTLRNAAQIYDDVRAFIEKKFGKPMSSHDGRDIYRVDLNKVLAQPVLSR
jgi:hypothetical protein